MGKSIKINIVQMEWCVSVVYVVIPHMGNFRNKEKLPRVVEGCNTEHPLERIPLIDTSSKTSSHTEGLWDHQQLNKADK